MDHTLDPDRHSDDRTADEQLADRAGDVDERFPVPGGFCWKRKGHGGECGPTMDTVKAADACGGVWFDDYPNGHFCHRLPECRGRSSCPRDIACTH